MQLVGYAPSPVSRMTCAGTSHERLRQGHELIIKMFVAKYADYFMPALGGGIIAVLPQFVVARCEYYRDHRETSRGSLACLD